MAIRNYSPSSVNDLAKYIEGLPWPEYPRGSLRWFGQPEYERGRLDLIRWCLRRSGGLAASDMRWLSEAEADPAPFERRDARRLAGIFQRLVREHGAPPVLYPGDVDAEWRPLAPDTAGAAALRHFEAARLLAEIAAIREMSPEALWIELGRADGATLSARLRRYYLREYPAGPLPENATRVRFLPPLRIDDIRNLFVPRTSSAEPPPAPPSLPVVPPPPPPPPTALRQAGVGR